MSRGKPQKPDARGGTYFLLPSCLIKSEAWRTASYRAIKALFVVAGKHSGFNNGRIAVSAADLAVGMDCQNHAANSAALVELSSRGIIEQTSRYARGVRLAREFRITFIPTDSGPATHDYLSWKLGDVGTIGKKRVAAVANETPVSVAGVANGTKLSIAAVAIEESAIDGKPPFSKEPSVAVVARHIGNHLQVAGADHSRSGGNANGPSTISGGVVSAAPDAEELRGRAIAFIGKLGRGGQGRLAKQAGIPGGTFSKFLNSKGPLSDHARVRLTCAFPRTEVAALKSERAV